MGSTAVTPQSGLPPLPPGAKLLGGESSALNPSTSTLPPLPPGAKLMSAPDAAAPSSGPAPSMTANPRNEGTYAMRGPQGAIAVPYSSVGAALQAGNALTDPEWRRYAKDYAFDPHMNVGALLDAHTRQMQNLNPTVVSPEMGGIVGGFKKEASRTVGGLLNILANNREQSAADRQQLLSQLESGAKLPNDPMERHLREGADWFNKNTDLNGFMEHVGGFGENMAELLTPEALGVLAKGAEAAKGVEAATGIGTAAQKYADAANISKVLGKYKNLRTLVGIGLAAAKRAAVEAGLQTYVKTGGDAHAALEGGAVAAGTAGLASPAVAGAGEALSGAVAKRATTIEDVGGVPTPVPAEVRNARPTEQQAAGQKAITGAAQNTLAARLQEVNESRAAGAYTNGPGLPARSGPFEFTLQGMPPTEGTTGDIAQRAAKVPQSAYKPPQYTTSSAPIPTRRGYEGSSGADIQTSRTPQPSSDVASGAGTLKTQDPKIAIQHVANLNAVIDSPDFAKMPTDQQSQILAARQDAQQQLGQYHDEVMQRLHYGKANYPQIDIPTAVSKIGSYPEAVDALEKTGVGGFNDIADSLQLNDISGGKYATIRNANQAAWETYKGATTDAAREAAEGIIDDTNQQMDHLLAHDIGGSMNLSELQGFKTAYKQAQTLRYVSNAVDGAFKGNSASATKPWEYRGFDGNQLMGNLDRVVRKLGRGTVERVVGKENLDTLYQTAELNRTPAQRAKFGSALQGIADSPKVAPWLHVGPIAAGAALGHLTGVGPEVGAAAGAGAVAANMGMKRLMNTILTNPKIAQNLIYAIDSGARPGKYVPMIAAMVQQVESERAKGRYAQTAINKAGHRIGTNDGWKTGHDVLTGEQVHP